MPGLAHIQQPFAIGGNTTVQMRGHLQAAGQHRGCLRLHSCDRQLHKFLRAVSVSKRYSTPANGDEHMALIAAASEYSRWTSCLEA